MFLSVLGCIPARYILAVMGSIGMAIIYGLKVNLSVTMVAMLNHSAIGHGSHDAQPTELNSSVSLGNEVCQAPGGETVNTVEVSLYYSREFNFNLL